MQITRFCLGLKWTFISYVADIMQAFLSLLLLYCMLVCVCGTLGFLQPNPCCLQRVLPLRSRPASSFVPTCVSCSCILLSAFSHPSSSRKKKISDIWKRLVGKAISDHSVPADHTQLTRGSETLALFEPLTSLQLKWRSLGYFSPLVLSSAFMGEWRARALPARDIRRLWRRLRVMGLS